MRLLIPLLLVLGACGTLDHIPPHTRSEAQSQATVVQVHSNCNSVIGAAGSVGTGLVISEAHVLTAAHVVFCPSIPAVTAYLPARDRFFQMEVIEDAAVFGDGTDIAKLRLVGAYDRFKINVAPPAIGVPHLGDTLCIHFVGRPEACGIFDPEDGKLWVDAPSREGDSGAPISNEDGELVGFVHGGDGTDTDFTPVTQHWLSGT